MFRLVQSSGRLQVAAESVTSATADDVWALVADATRYPEWGPWSAAGYRGTAGHAVGAVYWLRSATRAYGRYVTTVERVEEIDQGRRIGYTVVGGTMPVRGYRGEVTLTPVPEGTRVSWTASWDKTLGGRLVWRGLRDFFPTMMASLTAAAASQQGSP
jgi:Polyketide cyclase / dehydrase and lipid transport